MKSKYFRLIEKSRKKRNLKVNENVDCNHGPTSIVIIIKQRKEYAHSCAEVPRSEA